MLIQLWLDVRLLSAMPISIVRGAMLVSTSTIAKAVQQPNLHAVPFPRRSESTPSPAATPASVSKSSMLSSLCSTWAWSHAYHSAGRSVLLATFHRYVSVLDQTCTSLTALIIRQLSFVAGAICGHTSVSIFDTTSTPPSILSAPEAIAKYNLDTITLAAKEGLGILNGTAFSASAGAIALFEAEVLGMMAQAVTAMTVEASRCNSTLSSSRV